MIGRFKFKPLARQHIHPIWQCTCYLVLGPQLATQGRGTYLPKITLDLTLTRKLLRPGHVRHDEELSGIHQTAENLNGVRTDVQADRLRQAVISAGMNV